MGSAGTEVERRACALQPPRVAPPFAAQLFVAEPSHMNRQAPIDPDDRDHVTRVRAAPWTPESGGPRLGLRPLEPAG
jgi:hypothetical protein